MTSGIPVKILFIYGDVMNRGGIERFMMNYFLHMTSGKVHVDFVVQSFARGAYDEEIEARGSKIYYLPKVGRHPLTFRAELMKILKSGEYPIIHSNCDAMNYRILKMAKHCRIPVRISHSHNTKHILNSRIKLYFYEYCRKHLAAYATDCWACSREAGKWLYGDHKFTVVPNAIDTRKFSFNESARNSLREKFGVSPSDFLLGHIGRFDFQKNHTFLIDLLMKLRETDTKYKLLLVGDGWLRPEIEKKVRENALEESVIFTGSVDNPQDYYNMMDLFVLPSLFEGYPLVTKEAESNGLNGIASNLIPKEVGESGHLRFCELDLNLWVEAVRSETGARDLNAVNQVRADGYDIVDAASGLEDCYVSLYREAVSCKKGKSK